MPSEVVPCCSVDNASRVRDLEHFYGFDFDLFECPTCGRYWVWAWYEGTNSGGWEQIDQEDGRRLTTLPEPQLRAFMKVWARKFD